MTRSRTLLSRIALLAAITTSLAVLAPSPANAATRPLRTRMLSATNHSRVEHSVRKVDIHWRLSKLARRHSVAMANKGTIFHTSKPASYYLEGVRWSTWGENVGVTGGTVGELQRAFMDSASHRANILNRGFRRAAVGAYRDDRGLLWVTVFFYG
jgi:uncharacterized protein YkwD